MDHRVLLGRTAQTLLLVAGVFVALSLVRDPTDALWGAPGTLLHRAWARFDQRGAPVLGGAEGTTALTADVLPGPVDDPPPSLSPDPNEPVAPPPHALTDPGGVGMAHVREALGDLADHPDARVRILHYGDSLIDTDFVSGTTRRLLQERFGDGGHGWVNVGKPWPWYRHWDVRHFVRGSWNVKVATRPIARDGRYGLGGATFRSWGGTALFGTSTEGPVGHAVSRFEVAYLEQPAGGTLILDVDGAERLRVDTAGPAPASRWAVVDVPDGPHELLVRRDGSGDVRLFGVSLERAHGVIYDTLGINGARIRILDRFDEAHWTEQLRHARPDLVILGFGLNESENAFFPVEHWPELPRVVGRIRRAVPDASCLIVGPPDRVDRRGARRRSSPIIRRLSDKQREVAVANGCAFFDLQEAMGGDGAAARWARSRPRLVSGDFVHPTTEGAARLGEFLYQAIAAGH